MCEEDKLSVKWEESQGNMIFCWDVEISRGREWTAMPIPILLQTEKNLEERICCLEDESSKRR